MEAVNTEEVVKNGNVTMDDIERISKVVQAQATKQEYDKKIDEIKEQQDALLGYVSGLTADKDILHDKLKTWNSEDLKKYIYASEKNTDFFFRNDETGEVLTVNIDTTDKGKILDFKRNLLIYLKTTDETWEKIDEEYKKLDDATNEFNENIHNVVNALSDNILMYISYIKDKANEMEDGPDKRRLLKGVKYEESAYTMQIYRESYEKYPSAIRHCKEDIKSARRIREIGSRYIEKLQRIKTSVSLIPFISDDGKVKSFEERVLLRDQYEVEDLFVFSLIRFFAMADWSDPDIKRAHSVMSLVIKRLVTNDFEDESVKEDVKTAIVEYLKLFK